MKNFLVIAFYGILGLLFILIITPPNIFDYFRRAIKDKEKRLVIDLWCHHLGVILFPVYLYFHRGFDLEELIYFLCIPTTTFLWLSYLMFTGKQFTAAIYDKPDRVWMRRYFYSMISLIFLKALAPNILNFSWLLISCFTVEIFFSAYLLIMHWGVQKVDQNTEI